MSGVCRMLGTWTTTSIPTNAARTKTVRYSTMPVVDPPVAVLAACRMKCDPDSAPRPCPGTGSSTAAGAMAVPPRSTHMPVTISSSQSGASVPSVPMSPSTLATLRA